MDALLLEAFKARLHRALSSLICWLTALPVSGVWN